MVEIEPLEVAQTFSVEDAKRNKRSEDFKNSRKAKYSSVVEQLPTMIFVSSKGRIVYVNKKAEEITGYKRKELYSLNFDFLHLVAPESIELVESVFDRQLKGEEVAPFECRFLTKEGRKICAILTSKSIFYEREPAILGTVTDISSAWEFWLSC